MTDDDTTDEQTTDEQTEEDVFPRRYVEALRTENAELRVKGKSVDTIRDALRAAVLKQACTGILQEPIPWDDQYDDDSGLPDPEKIRAAAEDLAEKKPWLSRPHGDAGQGFRGGQSDTVNLADLLRSGA
jgi:hypothetical protein